MQAPTEPPAERGAIGLRNMRRVMAWLLAPSAIVGIGGGWLDAISWVPGTSCNFYGLEGPIPPAEYVCPPGFAAWVHNATVGLLWGVGVYGALLALTVGLDALLDRRPRHDWWQQGRD